MVECVCLGERFCRCKIVIGFHFPKREESREEGRVPTAHAAPAHSECGPLACLDGFTFRRVLDRPAYLCPISCCNNNLEYDSAYQNEKKCKWACVLCFSTAMCSSSLNYFISRTVLSTLLQFCTALDELWCKNLQYFHSR